MKIPIEPPGPIGSLQHFVGTTQTEAQDSTMQIQGAKDFFAGAAGGVAQVLIGQPFDLVKVRVQARRLSALQCARDTLVHEGPRAFFKGTTFPLMGIGACVSIQFSVFHGIRGEFERHNALTRSNRSLQLSMDQFYLSGGCAGVANSIISNPLEHVRIQMQTQPLGANRLYTGPFDCARKIIGHEGLKGLFRGQNITSLQEFHTFGVWFASFETYIKVATQWNGVGREELPPWKIAMCGSLAGETLLLLRPPLDIVKSRLQSDGFGPNRNYKGAWDCIVKTYRARGLLGMYTGLGTAMARAIPVSAGIFSTVEFVRRTLA